MKLSDIAIAAVLAKTLSREQGEQDQNNWNFILVLLLIPALVDFVAIGFLPLYYLYSHILPDNLNDIVFNILVVGGFFLVTSANYWLHRKINAHLWWKRILCLISGLVWSSLVWYLLDVRSHMDLGTIGFCLLICAWMFWAKSRLMNLAFNT